MSLRMLRGVVGAHRSGFGENHMHDAREFLLSVVAMDPRRFAYSGSALHDTQAHGVSLLATLTSVR